MLDFLIGFLMMNAMPHLILGTWKVRMLSGFGFGHLRNIAWGIFNLIISLSIYLYTYGFSHLKDHLMFFGALSVGLIFVLLSPLWRRLFKVR